MCTVNSTLSHPTYYTSNQMNHTNQLLQLYKQQTDLIIKHITNKDLSILATGIEDDEKFTIIKNTIAQYIRAHDPNCPYAIDNNPNVTIIATKNGTSINIQAIKAISDFIHNTACTDRYKKIVIIHNAEQMTETASNYLLKTIEELPKKTVFIMTTKRSTGGIPKTILSRCIRVHMPQLQRAEILHLIKSENPLLQHGEALQIAEIAQGSIDDAIYLTKNNGSNIIRCIQSSISNPNNRKEIEAIKTYAYAQDNLQLAAAIISKISIHQMIAAATKAPSSATVLIPLIAQLQNLTEDIDKYKLPCDYLLHKTLQILQSTHKH